MNDPWAEPRCAVTRCRLPDWLHGSPSGDRATYSDHRFRTEADESDAYQRGYERGWIDATLQAADDILGPKEESQP